MTITIPKKKPAAAPAKIDQAAADAFISGAPDSAASAPKLGGVKKGNKQQISLTITPGLLAKVDELADKLGQSRAAVINMALYQAIERGLDIDGLHRAA